MTCGTASAYTPVIIAATRRYESGYAIHTFGLGACFNSTSTIDNPAPDYFTGDIGEVLIYNSTLDSQDDTRRATT